MAASRLEARRAVHSWQGVHVRHGCGWNEGHGDPPWRHRTKPQ